MKKKIDIILNIFIGVMSYAAWIFMAFFTKDVDELTSSGFTSLKYFTVLSNLLNGTISLIYLYNLITKKEIKPQKHALKLVGTSAVGLTFITVLVFLGPLYGYDTMFNGGNKWMHLILPVASFIDYIFIEEANISFKYTFYTIIPPLIYSILYVINIIINGIGEWPNRNDFYSFLYWGNIIGAVIAFTILLITWLISIVLYNFNRLYKKEE